MGRPMPNAEPIQILLVEDNPGDAYLVRYTLDEEGEEPLRGLARRAA
jgi:hypothetical protein